MTPQHEVLDLGLVYYKNIIPNPQRVIDLSERLAERVSAKEHGDTFTMVQPWNAWKEDHLPNPFNYKFFIWRHHEIQEHDFYRNELIEIADSLYGSLDEAFNHYSSLYPFARNSVKSEEPMDGILRYEAHDEGHLPPHQDLGVSSRLISTVSYLNDNYTGGEIEFKQSGVKIKPEAGSIVFFPSNFLYVHEVMTVREGTRYAMPHWYHHLKEPRMSDGSE
ncbi:MAG: 2OG-Fe(II) oxygenase [Candidatus Nanopelagicales bacterium]